MSDLPITDTLAVQVLSKLTDDLLADIDRRDLTIDLLNNDIAERDATIDDLRGRLARMTSSATGTHEANVALFRENVGLRREIALLQTERAEGWGA